MCSVMDTGQNRLLQFDRDLLSGKIYAVREEYL